jgi:hypothetical protein
MHRIALAIAVLAALAGCSQILGLGGWCFLSAQLVAAPDRV